MATSDASEPSVSSDSYRRTSLAKQQKRVSLLTLTLMGVAPIVIYSWDPLHKDMRLFSSVEECANGTALPQAACQALQAEALGRNEKLAPTYSQLEACEADFVMTRDGCEIGQWCTPETVVSCQMGADSFIRPEPSGFMASTTLLRRVEEGTIESFQDISDTDLQPIYGVSSQTLSGGNSSGYLGGWYYFTNQGHHLGKSNTREQRLHRHFLSSRAGPHIAQAFDPNSHSRASASSGAVTRGGFGAVARNSMARAAG
ncbi:DUF1190 domain-containing protein [Billgrantia sp. Q4P2]|uniref:DUF1190 domain-containing protein n=1 Tax=Billgrantia sp. Q4P2 TaxID=3463857 RepID=UPI0040569D7E